MRCTCEQFGNGVVSGVVDPPAPAGRLLDVNCPTHGSVDAIMNETLRWHEGAWKYDPDKIGTTAGGWQRLPEGETGSCRWCLELFPCTKYRLAKALEEARQEIETLQTT